MNAQEQFPALIAPFLLLLALDAAGATPGPDAPARGLSTLTGTYGGTYECRQGPRELKLALNVAPDGTATGRFTFYLANGAQKEPHSYSLTGRFNEPTKMFTLMPDRWETPPPPNYKMVGLNGTFTENQLTG